MKANPVFLLMFALPGAAVLGGFATLAIAMHAADRPLPEAYHWEGERLEADYTRQRAAVRRGIRVTLEMANGRCAAHVVNDDAATLDVLLTHGSDAGLDRMIKLPRTAAGEYAADCAPPPAGRWRISVDAPSGAWSVRDSIDGALAHVALRTRDPGGAGP